jgi:outer membrane protein OmpA-like peptidoglycan-associated protein
MKPIAYLIAVACAGLLVGCATAPPAELINARQAYQHASIGQAAQLAPADLHKAQEALAAAEKSFQDEPKSFHTRDLAYVADRKAKIAEAHAATAAENANTAKANKDYQSAQSEIVKNTKEDLAVAERTAAAKTEQLAAEQKARVSAENSAADAKVEAARVKESTDAEALRVKEASDAEARRVKDVADAEARRLADQKIRDLNTIIVLERGKKVVLKGVNFEFNKATLTFGSGAILTRAYNALVANPDVQIEISGHTDNVGSQQSNQKLSLRRAQAVRNWLVQKGIASNRMKTVGKGQNEPVASNETDEGRSENRRIEFYVQQ